MQNYSCRSVTFLSILLISLLIRCNCDNFSKTGPIESDIEQAQPNTGPTPNSIPLTKPNTGPTLPSNSQAQPNTGPIPNSIPLTEPNTGPTLPNNPKTQPKGPIPNSIPLGHIALGNYNQQNHPIAQQNHAVGNGACTCIVGTLLKEIQGNPQLDLHQHPEKIDTILEKGIQFYIQAFSEDAQQGFATYVEDTLQKLGLEQDKATLVDTMDAGFFQAKMLANEKAIQQEVSKFNNTKKLAAVKVGPEVWGLISYGNGMFDLFDSHGKQELHTGNPAAFIQRANSQTISSSIWEYCPLRETDEQLDEAQEQNGSVYIYWLQ